MESTDTTRPLRFGSFELDVRLRELRQGPTRVRLQDQPFEILRLMLERPGDVVTREQLRRRLWPEGTFVDFEHSLNAAVKRLRAALGDDADNPRFVETLPRRGYRFIAPLNGAAVETPTAQPSREGRVRLAVLPFANLSDGAQEYFSDGLTEEMIAQLGAVCRGRIGVISRWSSMMFKGTTRRAREVADALQADYLLEGSVRREGDRVRVTARLVEAAGETDLWSGTYDRDLNDCLAVQGDVAARIARSLAMELIPEQRAGRPTADPAAYQAYLKGRYYWNKPLDDGLSEAVEYYERAIALSPAFGAAHAALARARVASGEYYHELPRLAFVKARQSAARALEIDATLYEAFVADADVRHLHDRDWRGAEAAYVQAIAINPSCETAHRKYAALLSARGRHAEAMRESDRACDLDPLCLTVAATAAWVRYAAGDYEGAIEECRNTIEMDPQVVLARRILGAACLQAGREQEAIVELTSAATLAEYNPVLLLWLAHAKAVTGARRDAERLLVEARQLEGDRYVSPYHRALAHTGLGDADAAFDALEQAWLDRDGALTALLIEPRFDALRGDPRYEALVERSGMRE